MVPWLSHLLALAAGFIAGGGAMLGIVLWANAHDPAEPLRESRGPFGFGPGEP